MSLGRLAHHPFTSHDGAQLEGQTRGDCLTPRSLRKVRERQGLVVGVVVWRMAMRRPSIILPWMCSDGKPEAARRDGVGQRF